MHFKFALLIFRCVSVPSHLRYPSTVECSLFYAMPHCKNIRLDTIPIDNISPPATNLSAELVVPVAEVIGAPELDEPLDPEALASRGIVSLAFWKPL